MPSWEILLAFFLATSVFAYIPGPAMLYAATQTIARGRRAGWLAALGIHLGGYVHVFMAAFGLAVLLKAVPVLYLVLKLGGAIYLIWLGVRMILSKQSFADMAQGQGAAQARSAFWQSVTVEVLNPKTALFYLAFLPQFADVNGSFPLGVQLFVLGTIVNIMFSSADVMLVILSDKIKGLLTGSSAANRWVQRVGGGILIALGINVAFNRT